MQKGLIEGIQCGDPHALGALSLFVAMLTTFTGIINSDDSKDFVDRVVDKDKLVQNLQRNWKPETTKPPYEPLPSLCLQDPSCRGSDPPTFEAYMRHRTAAEEQLKMTRDLQLMTSETHADRRPREYQWLPDTKSSLSGPKRESTPQQVVGRTLPPRTLDPMNAYDTSRWSLELAELWNGRFAQIAFVVAFGQEFVQNKGIIRGLQEFDPINIVALITSLVGTIGISAGFFGGVSVSDRTAPRRTSRHDKYLSPEVFGWKQSAREVGDELEASIQNYEMTREGRAQGQSQSPSSFPVDGYRFKTSTQAALGASNASPHPDGVFHFKTETDRLIKDEGRKFARKSPRAPKKPSPPATTYPVEGYRFNKENQKMVVSPHPGGVFGFSSDNSLLIKQGAGKPTEIEKAAPSPTDVTPHPVEGFNFGRDTISVIKSDTRNRSVPLEKGRHSGRFYFPTGKEADTIQVPLEETSITRDSSYLDGLNSSFGASSVDGIAIATNDFPTGNKGPDKTEGQLKSDNMASSPHASTVQAKSEDAAFSISMDSNGDAANQSISDDQSSTAGRSLDFTTIPQKPKATREAGAGSVLDSPVTFGDVVEPIALGEESQLAVEIEAALGSYYNPVGGGSYLDALNRNTAGEDTQPPWLDEKEPVGAYGFGSSFPETLTARWEGGNSQWFP